MELRDEATHASAKITRPQTLRALPRARLFEQLDQARARRLTWIAAPPGGQDHAGL